MLIQIYTALTVYLLLVYQKFLNRIGLSVQQLLQPIQISLLGETSLEKLLDQGRRKIEISYDFSMLDMAA